MNRAAWRRMKFMRVEIVEKGLHYDGTLEFLGEVCRHVRERGPVDPFPGARRPRAEMPRSIDNASEW